jgi:WD40 repeat protein
MPWRSRRTADGRRLASASSDRTVRLWDARTGAAHRTLEGHTDGVNAVAFSPDSRRLASASGDETVRLWDARTGAAHRTLEGHSGSVRAVAFSPDGRRLASASGDETVRLWDASTGALQKRFDTDYVSKLSFSDDGSCICTDRGALRVISTSSRFRSQSSQSSLWMLRADWLLWDSQKTLWIPPDFRRNCSAFQGNLFSMGYSSGRVVFLGLEANIELAY